MVHAGCEKVQKGYHIVKEKSQRSSRKGQETDHEDEEPKPIDGATLAKVREVEANRGSGEHLMRLETHEGIIIHDEDVTGILRKNKDGHENDDENRRQAKGAADQSSSQDQVWLGPADDQPQQEHQQSIDAAAVLARIDPDPSQNSDGDDDFIFDQ